MMQSHFIIVTEESNTVNMMNLRELSIDILFDEDYCIS